MNPKAILHMSSGRDIVIELFPDAAPNTVNSFIHIASNGLMDHYAIQRIVPGKWVDVSYSGYGKKEAQYLIPGEFTLHPEITPLPSHPGCVCMGGYGDYGLAGGEIFFPLKDCPEHLGIYPVIGQVIEGMDEIRRIAEVPVRKLEDFIIPEMIVYEPVTPEIIETVELELYGKTYPEPVKQTHGWIPPTWK
ncbi:MAG: peptidylprolyl isomerase [Solobacterium sp.]|nr:peptidylprolyl isomerase [Solobacterium sp.]